MESLNIILSKVVLEDKKRAMQKMRGYTRALELNNRKKEALAFNNINIALKKINWRK